MRVIIPLAGFGTRLRPHTYTRPKPLINVAGRPVLGHILDKLADAPVDEYIFVVGYLGDKIEEYIKANYSFRARFVEQKELLGQAHAISLCDGDLEGPLLIIFVDTLFEADLDALADEKSDGVIYVKEVEDPRRFGVVSLGDDGCITRFVEKPSTMDNRLAVIGLYYVRDGAIMMQAIDELMRLQMKTKGEYYLADAFQIMIDNGAKMRAEEVDVWLDCGKPETVLGTNRYLLEHGADTGPTFKNEDSNCIIVPPVHIAPSAKINNSVIGPHVTISDGCIIENSIIHNSIIGAHAHISDAMLEASLIGEYAVVTGAYRSYNVGDSSHVGFS
jgi:glucose-1-phosphate thymidylyltransferase